MSEEVMKTDGCFDTMTTQQLEDLLRADAEGTGNLDTDSLFYIMELLAQELGIPMEEVTKFGGNSRMVMGRIGE